VDAASIDEGRSVVNATDDEAVRPAQDVFRKAEKPILVHCNSGADRSGLVSALYVAAIAKLGFPNS
jgi:protein tyrosine/serine phosphatase